MEPETIKETCDRLRAELLVIEKTLRGIWMRDEKLPLEADGGEMRDQSMLAVRAVEDARMRCGKVLQYARDGISCFDK